MGLGTKLTRVMEKKFASGRKCALRPVDPESSSDD